MPSIRVHKPNGALFFDFRFNDERCREYTLLPDTVANRKKLEKVLDKIESEIASGTFVYENYFPNSKALQRLSKVKQPTLGDQASQEVAAANVAATDSVPTNAVDPLFKDFATTWFNERSIEWRRSHIKSLLSTLNGRLVPYFGERVVGSITKSDILEFRATLAKVKGRGQKEGLSPKRINEIMGLLRQIMNEAADRFQFTSPVVNIKKLRQPKADVQPFSLVDVQRILATVRADYKNYFVTRFFTGMRTGEVHGLKWKYVDFDLRIIRVRETFVLGEDDYTKTEGSQRDIQMSQPVFDALKAQQEVTGSFSEYVFCNLMGGPLDNKNFTDRVWYPLLRYLDLAPRRPYGREERDILYVATFVQGCRSLLAHCVVGDVDLDDVLFTIVRGFLHRLDDAAPRQASLLRLCLGWGNSDEIDDYYVPRLQQAVHRALRTAALVGLSERERYALI